jgi:hypothetical protein
VLYSHKVTWAPPRSRRQRLSEDSDDADCINIRDVEEKSTTYISSFDIIPWREELFESGAEPLSRGARDQYIAHKGDGVVGGQEA